MARKVSENRITSVEEWKSKVVEAEQGFKIYVSDSNGSTVELAEKVLKLTGFEDVSVYVSPPATSTKKLVARQAEILQLVLTQKMTPAEAQAENDALALKIADLEKRRAESKAKKDVAEATAVA